MENHLSSEFLSYYNNTVKPIALKCAEGYQTMVAVERGETIPDDHKDMVRIKTCVDANAIWYIGLMIGDIERYAIKGIRLTLLNSLSQVHGCLTSESYWRNVWKNDESSEEAKNLRQLGDVMPKLLSKL